MVVLKKEEKASCASASLQPRLDLSWRLIKMRIRNKIYPSACWDFRSVMAGQLYHNRAGTGRLTAVADSRRNHSGNVCLSQISSGLKYWIYWVYVYAHKHKEVIHMYTRVNSRIFLCTSKHIHMVCATSSACIYSNLPTGIKIIRLTLQKRQAGKPEVATWKKGRIQFHKQLLKSPTYLHFLFKYLAR